MALDETKVLISICLVSVETSMVSCSLFTWGFTVVTPPFDKRFIRGMNEHVIAGWCRRPTESCIFLAFSKIRY